MNMSSEGEFPMEGGPMIGLQRKIVKLAPYSPEWKRFFAEEEHLLRASIGAYVVDIQHVGSTAIPGLEAKPIIDIAVALRRLEDVGKCIEPLKRLGYEYKGEEGHPGRFFLAKGDPRRRTHYLHMVEWNSDSWKELLRFRDYLRQHKEVAEEYARLKRELAQKSQGNRDLYTPGKAEFIETVLRMAEDENHSG
jgi:GrpB-like predicted nucleotidyltransferase (UPF0157 family)